MDSYFSSIRKYREYVVLFSIFLIALALRLTTAKYDLLLGADPWYHYNTARTTFNSGSFPMWDSSIYYPNGTWPHPLVGLYYLPIYFYKLTAFMGISFFKSFQLLPAFFGALICLVLYLLVADIHSKKAALFTAILFSISPAGIERSLAGFYRGDVFFIFFMLLTLLLYTISMRRLPYSFPAGATLFASGLVWNGWPFLLLVLTFGTLIKSIKNYLKGIKSSNLIPAYTITCGVGLVLIYLQRLHYFSYTGYMPLLANEIFYIFGSFFAVIFLLVLIQGIGKFLQDKVEILRLAVPLSLFTLGILATFILIFNISTDYTPLGYISTYFVEKEAFITEKAGLSIAALIQSYNILLLLAPLGLYLSYKKKNSILLTYLFASLFLLLHQVRFFFLAAPAVCLLGAIAIEYLTDSKYSIKKFTRPGTFLLIALLLSVNTITAINFVNRTEPFVSSDLHESLNWMKHNTPEDSGIFAWWDYTGPIVGIAERRAIFITTPYRGRIDDLSKLLATSDEEKALNISEKYKADYILVDFRTYMLWPRIITYTEDMDNDLFDSILNKMYNKKPLENFELVFENKAVRIYRPLHNHTKISTFELDKYYYDMGEKMRINLKMRSNEIEKGKVVIKFMDFKNTYDVQSNTSSIITIPIPSNLKKDSYSLHAFLYDTHMENIYDERHLEFAITGEFLRLDIGYLVNYGKTRLFVSKS